MPTIQAKPIRKPRKVWLCADCRMSMSGPHVRMYGCADEGDKPYELRVCLDCAMRSGDEKVNGAARELIGIVIPGPNPCKGTDHER